jgi:hypothetical protein
MQEKDIIDQLGSSTSRLASECQAGFVEPFADSWILGQTIIRSSGRIITPIARAIREQAQELA